MVPNSSAGCQGGAASGASPGQGAKGQGCKHQLVHLIARRRGVSELWSLAPQQRAREQGQHLHGKEARHGANEDRLQGSEPAWDTPAAMDGLLQPPGSWSMEMDLLEAKTGPLTHLQPGKEA